MSDDFWADQREMSRTHKCPWGPKYAKADGTCRVDEGDHQHDWSNGLYPKLVAPTDPTMEEREAKELQTLHDRKMGWGVRSREFAEYKSAWEYRRSILNRK